MFFKLADECVPWVLVTYFSVGCRSQHSMSPRVFTFFNEMYFSFLFRVMGASVPADMDRRQETQREGHQSIKSCFELNRISGGLQRVILMFHQ